MSKKMMVLALAVVSAAMFAMPAVASATWNHIVSPEEFSVTGGHGVLTGPVHVTCSSTTGNGSFSNATEGTVNLKFHGCVDSVFGLPCKSGATSGTIEVKNKFHLIRAGATAASPGVLLTPHTGVFPTLSSGSSELKSLEEFVSISCTGISLKVIGKGVIGTLSPSVCSVASTTMTLTFSSSATTGSQLDQVWTGVSYDLKAGASHTTSSLDGAGTLHFTSPKTIQCT